MSRDGGSRRRSGWPFGWDAPRTLLASLAVVTLVALVVVSSTSAAAFGTYNPAWDGASSLRAAARDAGSEATVARNLAPYARTPPSDAVAIVLAPSERYTPAEVAVLRRFVRRGGTLVVADDFGPYANPLLAGLGARSRIVGTPLRDERHYYRSPNLPVATNVTPSALTAGVDGLTLNHASAVRPNGATVLVRTSDFAYADANRNGALDPTESLGAYPVVTTEAIGAGRLVVAGDPSLFINAMLARPGNAAFVRNLFAGRSAVILDYSHAGGFPPLALALLVLRSSTALQAVVGLLGLGLVWGWTRGWLTLEAIRGRRASGAPDVRLTERQLVDYLERRHPDWDDERVRRVVGGIMNRRPESPGDA